MKFVLSKGAWASWSKIDCEHAGPGLIRIVVFGRHAPTISLDAPAADVRRLAAKLLKFADQADAAEQRTT